MKGFDQFSTTKTLAKLQATEGLKWPYRFQRNGNTFWPSLNLNQSAESYLSEMRQQYLNAGDMTKVSADLRPLIAQNP